MAMADWTNEFSLRFLAHYQKEPVLWNPLHSSFKDKRKKYEAWTRLSGKLQRPVSELKRKKDSLMATFRGQIRKKKASIRSGADADNIHKPKWFAYEFMEKFLAPVYKGSSTINIDESSADGIKDVEENVERVTRNTTTPTPISRTGQSTTTQRRANSPELQEASNHMKQAFNLLNNVISKRAPDNEEEDECDLFGKMLAKKLRKLPEHEREIFMYEIDGMFISRVCRDNPTTTTTTAANTTDSFD